MAKKNNAELVPQPKEHSESATPATLLQMAVEKGAGLDQLEKLMDLQERWEKGQAKKAFLAAISKFQGICPEIQKKKQVAYDTRNGGKTGYKYATLGEIVKQIKQALVECGLSFRWELQEKEKSITCVCIISHIDGHSESTTMSAEADTSGNKNAIQSRGSSVTYLQRYTLIGALGISTADEDVDGQGTKEEAAVPEDIQAEILRITDYDAFIEWVNEQKEWHNNAMFKALCKKRRAELSITKTAKA